MKLTASGGNGMHAHDRTLLASLGFADKDKSDQRHDLACQYIAQQETTYAILGMLVSEVSGERWAADLRCNHEYLISKGDGKYKTTIGFADVLLSVEGMRLASIEVESKRLGAWLYFAQWLLEDISEKASFIAGQNWSEITRYGRTDIGVYSEKERGTIWKEELLRKLHERKKFQDVCVSILDLANEAKSYHPKLINPNTNKELFNEIIEMAMFGADRSYYGDKSKKFSETLEFIIERLYGVISGSIEPCFFGFAPTIQFFKVLFEIKIGVVSTGDLIRQFRLYEEHVDLRTGMKGVKNKVAVTAWMPSESDVKQLADCGIYHVKLGKGFEEFCRKHQGDSMKAKSNEI